MACDYERIKALTRELLSALGENPDRPGLRDTPRRVADAWREFIDYDPGKLDTTFTKNGTDQMVVISGMRVWSMCEHHLLPFWCDVSVGYIASDSLLGLSKFGRIAHACAHRLQLQEQMVEQIADLVMQLGKLSDVAVFASGEHLCMTMRGIRTPSRMSSSVMRGAFRADPATRAEFLSLVAKDG